MVSSARPYAFVLILAALVAALVVFGTRGGATSTGEPLPASTSTPIPAATAALGVNRIVYVGLDRQIWTARPDGSDKQKITLDDGRYAWPTWSPDGRRMVFSGVFLDEVGRQRYGLYSLTADSGAIRKIHATDPGVTNLVAPDTLHYPLWSPDSSRLAFLAPTFDGLVLYIHDFRNDLGPVSVFGNPPLYLSWSPSSRYVLVHRAADHFLVDTDDGVDVRDLKSAVPGYRAPSWWPSGDSITVVASADRSGGFGIYVKDLAGEKETLLERVRAGSAFLWSPSGEFLALGRRVQPGLPFYGILELLSPEGTKHSSKIDEPMISFFWSPDSTKLAYVTLTDRTGVFRWNVMRIEDGERWPLVDFIPSVDSVTILQYFDQYAYSHALWSPDSASLVFAGNLWTGGVSISHDLQQAPQVIVVGTERNPSSEVIAEGSLAFWSHR